MNKQLALFLKFGLVGLANTGIDFLVFTLLTFCGWRYLSAQAVSFTCGLMNSYLLNRSWTFRRSPGSSRFTFYKFFLLNVLLLLFTSGLIALLHQGAGWPISASKLLATAAGALVNFAGSRVWVFRQNQTV